MCKARGGRHVVPFVTGKRGVLLQKRGSALVKENQSLHRTPMKQSIRLEYQLGTALPSVFNRVVSKVPVLRTTASNKYKSLSISSWYYMQPGVVGAHVRGARRRYDRKAPQNAPVEGVFALFAQRTLPLRTFSSSSNEARFLLALWLELQNE